MPLHPCPECHVEALLTLEQKGAIHLDCPSCQAGTVFRDARGGYECTSCDQRFLIHESARGSYGGPEHVGGPLRWWERPMNGWGMLAFLSAFVAFLWLVPVVYWSLLVLPGLLSQHWRKKR